MSTTELVTQIGSVRRLGGYVWIDAPGVTLQVSAAAARELAQRLNSLLVMPELPPLPDTEKTP